jgi:MFS family permease
MTSDTATAIPARLPAMPPPSDRVGTFSSLRIHNFRIFAASQIVSNSGAWTQRVAQDWLVLTLTGSPAAVGITTALQFAPSILFSMIGGLAADRVDKRRILLTTQTTLAACSAVLATLCLAGVVQYWQVLILAVATGTAAAFDNPTRQAFVHDMVGARHLGNAVSINSAVFQIGALIGPAVSAVLIAAIGIGYSFAANALSFGVVITALLVIDKARLFRTPVPPRRRGQVKSALQEIRRRPELRWPIVLAGVCGFVTANFPVVLVAFTKEMSFGPGGYGLLTCSLAAGSLVGALMSARRPHTRLRHLTALALAIAATLLVTALMPGTVTLCVALVVTGTACVPFGITANTTIQLAAGDDMRGRVMGVYMLAVLGAAGAGGPVIGYLVEYIGARGGLAACGLAILAVTCYAILRLSRASDTSVTRLARLALNQIRSSRILRDRPAHSC